MDANRQRRTIEGSFVALLFAALGLGGVWYASGTSMPELASLHGAGIDAMMNDLLVTVGGLFLAGYLALAWLIWTGSRRESIGPRLASRRAELVLSGALGLGMALVAEGGVLAIGIPVWAEYFNAVPPDDAVSIEVTAQQLFS